MSSSFSQRIGPHRTGARRHNLRGGEPVANPPDIDQQLHVGALPKLGPQAVRVGVERPGSGLAWALVAPDLAQQLLGVNTRPGSLARWQSNRCSKPESAIVRPSTVTVRVW